MKFSEFDLEQINELKDEDTGEFIPSVMRMGDMKLDFRFHHDPDASNFFDHILKSPQFKKTLAQSIGKAFSEAVRSQPHVGGTNWYDDVTIDVKDVHMNQEELESTQMD